MNKGILKDVVYLGLIFALCLFILGLNLGKPGLLDPDEPFYSLTAKEMLQASNPWVPRIFGEPQFEKPIFFYWVIYACFRIFGISEFAARLGPCLAGMITAMLVYIWGKILFKKHEPAFASSAILATSGQFVVLSRVVLTDIFLCLFVTAAWTVFSWGYFRPKYRTVAWNLFFVFAALGFLTKGPLGFMVPLSGIVAYAFSTRELDLVKRLPWFNGLILFSIVGFPWYAAMAHSYGVDFLKHFFVHENIRRFFVAEHRGMDAWYFYPFVVAFGFFPWTALVGAGLWRSVQRQKVWRMLACFFFPSFIFFMLAKSKLMSYIFPLYPVAALMAGAYGWRLFRLVRSGGFANSFFSSFMAFAWVGAPVILVAVGFFIQSDIALPMSFPIYAIAATLIPLSWTSFFLYCKKKIFEAFCVMIGNMAVFSALSFGWLLPSAGEAFSSKTWARDYIKGTSGDSNQLFLASKMFIRGMTYYAGINNVGVFSGQPKGGFYTPHSIPIFSGTSDLLKVRSEQFPVYLMIRNKEYRLLKDDLGQGYTLSVLENTPTRLLVRLERV